MHPSMKAEFAARAGDLRLNLLLGLVGLFSLPGSRPAQRGQCADHAEFRIQRRGRSVRVCRRLYGHNSLRKDDAGTRVGRDGNSHFQAAMAALRRLCRPVCGLYRTHRIRREKIARFRTDRRVQRNGYRRSYDPHADSRPAAAGQAAQSRSAATVHRPNGALSTRAAWHDAPAESHDGGVDLDLLRRPSSRLEPVFVSRRTLVLEPVLLAVAVCVRHLAGRDRRPAEAGLKRTTGFRDPARCGLAVSYICAGRDDGRKIPANCRDRSGLPARRFSSQPEGEPRPLPG